MAFIVLSLLFFLTGAASILYFQATPSGTVIRQRFPNRITVAGIVFTVIIAASVWYIVSHSAGLTRVAYLTTMLFFFLFFETIFLLVIRRVRSNILAMMVALFITAVPFAIQFLRPSHALSNLVIIAAVMGATALLVRLGYFRTRLIILLAVLLAINDALNVYFLVPKLGLTPVSQPQPLLIFPVVTTGGRIVGSGDFMFLVLTTLIIFSQFGRRLALIYAAVQSLALLITFLIIVRFPGDFPFLTVMTPILMVAFFIGVRQQKTAAVPPAEK